MEYGVGATGAVAFGRDTLEMVENDGEGDDAHPQTTGQQGSVVSLFGEFATTLPGDESSDSDESD